MILLSIDPGYDKTGYAVFKSDHPSTIDFITSGLIKTNKTDELVSRLKVISGKIEAVIKQYKVDSMIMEQLFFFKNAKTVIAVAQAQGSLIALAADKELDFHFLTPLQIKQIVTGDGHADKKSVWKMLKLQLGDKLVVADDDESDAIACGYAYCLVNPTHGAKLTQ
jgi:crossover junction endodeoxyribonuclease RuvC